MIGNDIVDIAETQLKSNWQRPRFLEKLFTLQEQQYIQNSSDAFIMVWRLWSMKEAAYKLYTQHDPSRFYNPKQFKCEVDGTVRYKSFKCNTTTKTTAQYIYSEAFIDNIPSVSKTIKLSNRNYQFQSKTIYDAALTSISEIYTISKSELEILKSDFGIPSIYHNSKKLDLGCSISHHGNYGAFAFTEL